MSEIMNKELSKPVLRFSKEYPKLKFPLFTTMRLNSGEKYKYYMSNWFSSFDVISPKSNFTATLISINEIRIHEITDELAMFDACCTPKELYELFVMFYSRKPEWEGTSTKMLLLVFLKTS